jgi:hypothetical protein
MKANIALLVTYFMLVSWLSYSSTLKMGAACSSETSIDFQRTARHYIPEDRSRCNFHSGSISFTKILIEVA